MDVYEVITQEVIKQLEQGTAPWLKPWDATVNGPRNLLSKRPYHGLNVFLLLAKGYDSPWWLTFKQASQLGGSVRKGEKGTVILFWKPLEVKDPLAADGKKIVPMLRYYRVWNVEQTEGIEIPAAPVREAFDPHERAEEILKGYAHPPALREGGAKAAYSADFDMIFMPPRDAFTDQGEYYSTRFHEAGHSTGHKDRLNRAGLVDFDHFGSEQYSREELIAEMTAAFLSAEAGITHTVEASASYIAGWLRRLQNDPRAVVVAAGAAQRAADHILGREGTKS